MIILFEIKTINKKVKEKIHTNRKNYRHSSISGDKVYSGKLEEIMRSFVICNNLRRRENKSGEFFYEGSSPDEIALGDFAKEMFFELIERDEKNLKIQDHHGTN